MNKSEQVKPLFTLEKLHALTSGDKIAMAHFNSVFMGETVGRDLPKLRSSLEAGDHAAVKKYAHKMKSSIDLYAIETISDVVRDIENRAAQATDLEQLAPLVDLVETTLHKVRDEMNSLS